MVKAIRIFIASWFMTVAYFILPSKPIAVKKKDDPAPDILTKKKNEDTPVRFTDLTSYIERIQLPDGKGSACISICNQLKDLSQKKQRAIRLNFTTIAKYQKGGEVSNQSRCWLSELKSSSNGTWRSLRDLEINVSSVIILADEMIESMAQLGWGCMNDSSEQLHSYLRGCLKSNRDYVIDRCARANVESIIKIQLMLVVDIPAEGETRATIPTQIITKVAVTSDGEEPVHSAHHIFFRQRRYSGLKSKA